MKNYFQPRKTRFKVVMLTSLGVRAWQDRRGLFPATQDLVVDVDLTVFQSKTENLRQNLVFLRCRSIIQT